jgi:hydrogenase maturation protease
MPPRILIAGIGNIFLGDDAFGVEVVHRLAESSLPDSVRVVDFGIRGFDLTIALLDDVDLAILVDAAPRGEPPGTLYVIELELDGPDQPVPEEPLLDMHAMDPVKVLRLVKSLGGQAKRVVLVGCEPASLGSNPDWDVTPGLSEPVRRAVHQAVTLIESLVSEAYESRLAHRVE